MFVHISLQNLHSRCAFIMHEMMLYLGKSTGAADSVELNAGLIAKNDRYINNKSAQQKYAILKAKSNQL